MRVLVIVPAKDEAMTLKEVIQGIRHQGIENILVVNDASSDDSAVVAAEAGAVVLELSINLGAWGAIQTGMRYALENNYNACVTMDGDGQHDPEFIGLILAGLERSDVVIGASPERGGAGKQFVWRLLRALSGLGVHDLTSGFRAYNRHAMRLLIEDESLLIDYQDVGVLLICIRNKLRLAEVSVKMNPRKYGVSRVFSSWAGILRYLLSTFYLIGAKRW